MIEFFMIFFDDSQDYVMGLERKQKYYKKYILGFF